MGHAGKILVITGVILIIAGLILWLAGDKLNWIGHLPGDIRFENENTKFYFPVTTMILLSLFLSFILWIIRRFF
jgi:H+/Cl- antiporter ClcA